MQGDALSPSARWESCELRGLAKALEAASSARWESCELRDSPKRLRREGGALLRFLEGEPFIPRAWDAGRRAYCCATPGARATALRRRTRTGPIMYSGSVIQN